ncbi:MAG: DUF2961 domain-containing protein [Firmicutes bacterium]|nr:DUF2961 domain-containing protein [Bacillota bacterium]
MDITRVGSSLRELSVMRSFQRKRVSSYDRTGGNSDWLTIEPNQTVEIARIEGAGCITHIWMTTAPVTHIEEVYLPRKVVLRFYWDGEEHPSVEVPYGDFFGMGHGITKNWSSAPLSMGPEDGKAMNCFFPMPFADGARLTVTNESSQSLKFYYYIDYEAYSLLPSDELRFHATWRREITKGIDAQSVDNAYYCFGGENRTGEDNYVILDARGKGHYVGCHLNIHNLRFTHEWNWYGEGDDMIFIDGEPWPPSLHGTGTEDYFCTAWCPQQEFQTPYYGIILGGGPNWSGKVTLYRYHIVDPITFNESIRVTIEHGHANHRSDDYSSTAYWYQTEPHVPFAPLPPVEERLPLPDIKPPV